MIEEKIIAKLQQEIEAKNEKERKKSQRKKPSTKKNNNVNGDNEGQTSQQGLMGAIIQPYVIKSVAEMGASMLGLSENVGDVASKDANNQTQSKENVDSSPKTADGFEGLIIALMALSVITISCSAVYLAKKRG